MIKLNGKKAILNFVGISVVETMIQDLEIKKFTKICPYWTRYFYLIDSKDKTMEDCDACYQLFPFIGCECPCNSHYTKEELITILNELIQQSQEDSNDST